jgi:hypothetical protein
MWRKKDTYRDNPVTIEERKSLIGEQATAAISGRNCNCQGSIGLKSYRSLINNLITIDWLRPF